VASPGRSKQDDKAIFENDILLCSILDSLENIFKVESDLMMRRQTHEKDFLALIEDKQPRRRAGSWSGR